MIAYIHQNSENHSRKGTIALDIPKKDNLNTLFTTHSNQTLILMGIAQLHPNDRFEKKIGRNVATSNISWLVVNLSSIEIRGISHIFHFNAAIKDNKDENNTVEVRFGLSTIKETDEVRLLYGELN